VVEIEQEVDSECELTGIVSALNSLPRTPGIVFKNVKGYDFPLLEKARFQEVDLQDDLQPNDCSCWMKSLKQNK